MILSCQAQTTDQQHKLQLDASHQQGTPGATAGGKYCLTF